MIMIMEVSRTKTSNGASVAVGVVWISSGFYCAQKPRKKTRLLNMNNLYSKAAASPSGYNGPIVFMYVKVTPVFFKILRWVCEIAWRDSLDHLDEATIFFLSSAKDWCMQI